MTVSTQVVAYLSKRKTPATSKEIAARTGANWKTVRNVLGILQSNGLVYEAGDVKCKVDNAYRFGYRLATTGLPAGTI